MKQSVYETKHDQVGLSVRVTTRHWPWAVVRAYGFWSQSHQAWVNLKHFRQSICRELASLPVLGFPGLTRADQGKPSGASPGFPLPIRA